MKKVWHTPNLIKLKVSLTEAGMGPLAEKPRPDGEPNRGSAS